MIRITNFILLGLLRALNRYWKVRKFKEKLLSSKRLLENNFSNGDFNFIQIGANDGMSFDFLYDFVIARESKGIVIEPVKEYFDELCKNYESHRNVVPVNIAIHPNLKEIEIYKIREGSKNKYPDWVKGIASFDSQHHVRLKIETDDIVSELVLGDTLTNIVERYYTPKTINYLQIDTEGFDYQILKMINFSVINPSMIKFESINLSAEEKTLAKQLLVDNNYFIFDENGDTIGVQLNKVSLI